MALATSSLNFFRLIGATVGIAVMGSSMTSIYPGGAFQSALPVAVRQVVPPAVLATFNDPNAILNHAGSGLATIRNPQMVALITDAIKQGLAQSLHQVFAFCLCVMIIGLLSTFFLKEIKLRDKSHGQENEALAESTERNQMAMDSMD